MPLKINRFEILEEIGKGAMATVYRAYDPRIKRELAIKILRPEHSVNTEFRKRFLKETKAVGKLNHPNVIKIYDVGEFENQPYIAMELLTGKFLNEIMDGEDKLPIRDVMDMTAQLTAALECAHNHGVIHRDLKPANIAWSAEERRIILTDFGIARIENPEFTQSTLLGQVLGTPKYMSPEQILGKLVDGRSDLFSLGVILYQLISGQKPFAGTTMASLTYQITQENPPPLDDLTQDAPPRLIFIANKLLQKNPSARYQNCKELLQDLSRVKLEGDYARGKPQSSNKLLWIASAAAVVIAFVFVVKNFIDAPKIENKKSKSVDTGNINKIDDKSKVAELLQNKINNNLQQYECSSLAAQIGGDQSVTIKGHISHEEDLLSLMDFMDAIPDASNVMYEVETLNWPFCEVASILSADKQANIMTQRGLRIDTKTHSTQLYDGNELVVELSTPDFPSHIYVDYFRSDGSVIHLYPDNAKNSKPVAPSKQMTVGENSSKWQIKKPYGDGQIVVIASDIPLLVEKRPLKESAQNYLSVLHKQVVVNEIPLTAKFLMIMTNPKS